MTRRSFFARCAGLATTKPESALDRDLAATRAKFFYTDGTRLLSRDNHVWFTPGHGSTHQQAMVFYETRHEQA